MEQSVRKLDQSVRKLEQSVRICKNSRKGVNLYKCICLIQSYIIVVTEAFRSRYMNALEVNGHSGSRHGGAKKGKMPRFL